ncbi:MAG: YtxH domain-containing protein [Anaerolineaceae bacterium]|nr:YtxH domain-containing protein [Anaerolineaceae bacterium]
MSEHNNDFGVFLIGFAVGALTGAAVSLLLAPQSGEETRRIIKEKTIELKDKAVETYEETKIKAEKAYEDAMNKAEELAEATKEKAVELKQKGQVVIEEQREKLAKSISPKKPETKPAK